MDWVAVNGVDVALFMVVKNAVTPEWARTYNMLYIVSVGSRGWWREWAAYPVSEYVASLGINDKASSLTGEGGVGVEGACLAEMDGDDVFHDALDHGLPFCRVLLASDMLEFGHAVVLEAAAVAVVVSVHRRGVVVLARLPPPLLSGVLHRSVVGWFGGRLLSFGAGFGLGLHDSERAEGCRGVGGDWRRRWRVKRQQGLRRRKRGA